MTINEKTLNDQDSTAVMLRYREFAVTIVQDISIDYIMAVRRILGKKTHIIKDIDEAKYIIMDAEDFFESKLNLYLSNPDIDPNAYANQLKKLAEDDAGFRAFRKTRVRSL